MRILLSIVLLAAISQIAHAQIDDELRRAFNSISVTDPQIALGQRRGVITGGQLSYRTDVVTAPPLLDFDPPTLGAGCGGIDLYGGSLSFINKDAFVNYAKAVASNASGYLFHLGLDTVCGECNTILTDLRDLTHTFNLQQLDSCQMAKAIVDRGRASILGERATEQLLDSGAVSDRAEVLNEEGSAMAQLAQSDPEMAAELLQGNLVWNALRLAQETGAFPGFSDDDLQDLMSITGTMVICQPGMDGCPGSADEIYIETVPPALSLRDLIEGSSQDTYVLRCNETVRCNRVEKVRPAASFEGTARWIIERINEPATGLIDRARYADEPTQEELDFLAKLPEGSNILILARSNPAQARRFVFDTAPMIALRIVEPPLLQMLSELERTVFSYAASQHLTVDPEWVTSLRAVRQEMRDDAALIATQVNARADSYAIYQQMQWLVRSRDVPDPYTVAQYGALQ